MCSSIGSVEARRQHVVVDSVDNPRSSLLHLFVLCFNSKMCISSFCKEISLFFLSSQTYLSHMQNGHWTGTNCEVCVQGWEGEACDIPTGVFAVTFSEKTMNVSGVRSALLEVAEVSSSPY